MKTTQLEALIKQKGMRLTRARKEIFQTLEKAKYGLSAKEIFEKLNAKSSTDLASIYRNLEVFLELGLIHRFQDGSYSVCQHSECGEADDHIHFVSHCSSCGKKDEVESHSSDVCKLGKKLSAVSGSLSKVNEIHIQGLCNRCS